MVRKKSPSGHYYHEPPYTPEEQQEMLRRMDNVVSYTRPTPRPKKDPLR